MNAYPAIYRKVRLTPAVDIKIVEGILIDTGALENCRCGGGAGIAHLFSEVVH